VAAAPTWVFPNTRGSDTCLFGHLGPLEFDDEGRAAETGSDKRPAADISGNERS